MKVIRTIFYVFAVILALFGMLVIVCAFRPDITEKIEDLLYHGRTESVNDAQENLDGGAAQMNSVHQPQSDEAAEDETADDAGTVDESAESEEGVPETEDADSGILEDCESDYVAPDTSQIVVPENVSGKSGYRQIQDQAQQIDDAAVDDIQNSLDAGQTGDGLEFDEVFYPYYGMLDDKSRRIYRQIYANANALIPVFAPANQVTVRQLRNVFEAVYNDHPELFWLETAYSCKYKKNGECVEIDLEFNRTAQELEIAKADFNSQVRGIVDGAQGLADDYAKEKLVHDVLIDRISYDAGAEMNQSAYSALVNGRTVCAGYSRAFQYVMQQLGIPCYYCTGFAGESHAWNIVALDDGYYNVDTTWDDSGDGVHYDYFNKTDQDYASSHIRQEMSVYLPGCDGHNYRGIEPDSSDLLRSLADVGMTEEQVLRDMGAYYEDCRHQIMQTGMGHYSFSNVIGGGQLLEEWNRCYRMDEYRQAYMEGVMDELGAQSCDLELAVEELQGDRYLITHDIMLAQ